MARNGSVTGPMPSHDRTAAPRFLRLTSASVAGAAGLAADGGASARSRMGAITRGRSAASATDR